MTKEVKEEKVFTEKEVKEMVKQEKKNKNERSLFQKILNVVLWIIVLAWMAVCVIDFIKVQNEEDPIFCLKKSTIKTGTGTADVCTGLGYKVYDYNCGTEAGKNYHGAIQFGPFWTKSVCDKTEK